MQTIIDNKKVSLYYHADTKIVHHVYHRGIGGRELKEALNAGVDLLKQHRATKWLSDNRAIDAHTEEETTWVNTVWLPNAIEAGWKFWSLVVPEDFKARINMVEFVNEFYERGVRVMVFTDPDEGMAWLEQVNT